MFEIIRIVINKHYETELSNKIKFILSSISLFLNEYFLSVYIIKKISNKYDLIQMVIILLVKIIKTTWIVDN